MQICKHKQEMKIIKYNSSAVVQFFITWWFVIKVNWSIGVGKKYFNDWLFKNFAKC